MQAKKKHRQRGELVVMKTSIREKFEISNTKNANKK